MKFCYQTYKSFKISSISNDSKILYKPTTENIFLQNSSANEKYKKFCLYYIFYSYLLISQELDYLATM